MGSLKNHGIIIRKLRMRSGLTVRETAKKINRSIGWLSEIENGTGTARLTEAEFERVINLLGGSNCRNQFKTWIASQKNILRSDRTFDGAVLKHIRLKKGLTLKQASKIINLSISYLSKLESGHKPVSSEMRGRIMKAYGYSPSSFKNLSTDPKRSKAVPIEYKLGILLNKLTNEKIKSLFNSLKEEIYE